MGEAFTASIPHSVMGHVCPYCGTDVSSKYAIGHEANSRWARQVKTILSRLELDQMIKAQHDLEDTLVRSMAEPEFACAVAFKHLRAALKTAIADKKFKESCRDTKKKGEIQATG